MLTKIIAILQNVPDEILEDRLLAESNFSFLLQANYERVLVDFRRRFSFKRQEGAGHYIFMDPLPLVDLQVFDFVVSDYLTPQLTDKYNMTISLHNKSKERNPCRTVAETICRVSRYILEERIPHFLPYYEMDFSTGLPKEWKVPKGLEIFLPEHSRPGNI